MSIARVALANYDTALFHAEGVSLNCNLMFYRGVFGIGSRKQDHDEQEYLDRGQSDGVED